MARDLSSADCAFRDEVRHFLATALTPDLRLAGRRTAGIFTDYDDGQRWFRILAKKGWSVPHWPVEWGGCGWTPRQAEIFSSEPVAAGGPVLAPQGGAGRAATARRHGHDRRADRRPRLQAPDDDPSS